MFHEFLKSLSEDKSRTAILLDNLQKLLALLAMIVGAVWFIKEFYEFQKRNEEWTLKQQRLTARQTRLSNKQAELAIQQSDIVNQQMQLTLETSKLEIQSKTLAIHSARRKITSSEDTRYSISQLFEFKPLYSYDDHTQLFGTSLAVNIKNTYDQTLHVNGCLFNTFFARLPPVDPGPKNTLEIQAPPSAIQDPEEGPITWELVKSHPFVSYTHSVSLIIEQSRYYSDDNKVVSGGCAGEISPGDTLEYEEFYFIRAKATDMVGFSVDLDIAGVGWRWKSHAELLSTPKWPS